MGLVVRVGKERGEEVLVVVRSGGWCSELISPEKRRKNEEAFGGGCTENMRGVENYNITILKSWAKITGQ
ncbi:hypothetical protein KY285_000047 [Solanum tuberosum]|nr:hypothetical protein KY289_009966 [Solanum tuberosum]KAH0708077.1 hypothetical protein KY284_009504 [Solanum tuberosum]KAH0764176.1 hypothetical protein KY285_000047 [Solanum tuberosum]